MLLPAAITHVHQIKVSCPSIDCSVQFSSVTIACMGLHLLRKITFLPRPEVKRWSSDIGGTVGPLQQQLGFLFSKTQVAFTYAYMCTLLWDTWFALPSSIKYVSKQEKLL